MNAPADGLSAADTKALARRAFLDQLHAMLSRVMSGPEWFDGAPARENKETQR